MNNLILPIINRSLTLFFGSCPIGILNIQSRVARKITNSKLLELFGKELFLFSEAIFVISGDLRGVFIHSIIEIIILGVCLIDLIILARISVCIPG